MLEYLQALTADLESIDGWPALRILLECERILEDPSLGGSLASGNLDFMEKAVA